MARKPTLSIENLESRFNLSTVLTVPNTPSAVPCATDQTTVTTSAPMTLTTAPASTAALSPTDTTHSTTASSGVAATIQTGDAPPTTDAVTLASTASTDPADSTTTITTGTTSNAAAALSTGNTPDASATAATATDAGATGSAATTLSTTSNTALSINNYSAISRCSFSNSSGGFIGYNNTNSYVEYQVNVGTAGTYAMNVETSTAFSGGTLNISVNGQAAGSITVPANGSWTNFTTEIDKLTLAAGNSTIRLSADGYVIYNLFGVSFDYTSGGTTTSTTTSPTTTTSTTTSTSSNSTSTSTTTTSPTTTTSTPTATPTTTTTPAVTGTVAITSTNQGTTSELNIVGGSTNDTITVTETGSTLVVYADGVTSDYSTSYGAIMIYGGAGNDTITVGSSVNIDTTVYGGTGSDVIVDKTTGQATIVTIGDGAVDTVTGNGINTDFWIDPHDVLGSAATSGETVHRVASFYNGVSTSLNGQTFTEPTGTGATVKLTGSFWGTGPVPDDVIQGQLADCYFLATLQSMAQENPTKLQSDGVDLGDGTYAVEFFSGSTPVYVRVDGDVPANGPYANGVMYAHPGATGSIWAPIFEKAYAEYAGGMSYANISYGWMSSVLDDFGISNTSLNTSTDASIYATVSTALAENHEVIIGTASSVGSPLIGSHAYSVISAYVSGGTTYYVLRNPWGFDGAGNDGNPYDGLVTVTADQLRTQISGGVISLS